MTMTKDKTTPAFDSFTAFTPEAFKTTYEKFAKGFSGLAELNKDAFEAMTASAGVFAKGVEKAATTQTTFMKEAFEDAVETAQAATASRDFQQAIELQSEFVRKRFEKQVNHATALVDHWSEVAREAGAPLSERYADFVEKVQTFRP
jgi:phasin family protein